MLNPKLYRKALGTAIRNERLSKQWTQFDLACESEVHQNYISDLENANRNCSLNIIYRIANAFDVLPSVLLIKAEENLERR